MIAKLVLMASAAILSAATTQAAPITYTFAGQLSGSLADREFSLANVVFSLASDTDAVFQPSPAIRPTLFNSAPGTLRFSVNGAAGEFDALYNAFSITLSNNQSLVGLTETASNDLIDVVDPRLQGYDLQTAASPVSNQPVDFLNSDTRFSTNLGDLVLFDDEDAFLTFSASLASVVPEPATWTMMIAGFGMVGAAARRRKVALKVAID